MNRDIRDLVSGTLCLTGELLVLQRLRQAWGADLAAGGGAALIFFGDLVWIYLCLTLARIESADESRDYTDRLMWPMRLAATFGAGI